MRYGYLLPTRGSVMGSDDASTLSAKANADVIGLARRAESMGFRSVWVGDSVLAKPRLDPFTTLAAVGAATDSVELGTAVHLPPLRNAVTLAHRMATVDQLSGGRVLFGVGVGSGEDVAAEYGNVGVPFDRRGPKLDEILDVLSGLFAGGPVDYDGEFFDLDGADLGFTPVRAPPVYVGSGAFDPERGFIEPVRRRIAEHGDGWLAIRLDPEAYAAGLERARELVSEAGRDPSGFDPAYYLDVVIDDDREAAADEAREFYRSYYPELGDGADEWVSDSDSIGPAEEVAETLSAYADAGVETMVVRFPAGNQREQLARFERLMG